LLKDFQKVDKTKPRTSFQLLVLLITAPAPRLPFQAGSRGTISMLAPTGQGSVIAPFKRSHPGGLTATVNPFRIRYHNGALLTLITYICKSAC